MLFQKQNKKTYKQCHAAFVFVLSSSFSSKTLWRKLNVMAIDELKMGFFFFLLMKTSDGWVTKRELEWDKRDVSEICNGDTVVIEEDRILQPRHHKILWKYLHYHP